MSVKIEAVPDIAELVHIVPPTRCEHSNHNMVGWQHVHGGPATHWVRTLHNCDDSPTVYPACTPFVAYVRRMRHRPWMCPRCKWVDDGCLMVEIIGPIDP